MKRRTGFFHTLTLILAVPSTALLVFNMLGIRIFTKEIFFRRQTVSGVEILILIGFALILLFDISAFLWVFLKLRQYRDVARGDKALLILGMFCLAILVGDKTLVDEIGREYLLGWEVLGEWVILYAFLAVQLVYNVLVLWRLFRVDRGQGANMEGARHDRAISRSWSSGPA